MNAEKEFKRRIEDFGVDALLGHLKAQGHEIDRVRWPDREREGRQGQALGGVDVEFFEDGRPIGLEITELHESDQYARQLMETDRLIDYLKKMLGPMVRRVNQNVVIVRWTLHWLPKRNIREAALEKVISRVLAIAKDIQPGQEQAVEDLPDFVAEMVISCVAGQPNFGFVTSHYEQSMYAEGVAEALADRIIDSAKKTQLASYEDARILGLDRSFMPLTDLLAAALRSHEARIPPNWNRIYFVEPGVPQVVEVWRRTKLNSLPSY